MTSKKLHPVKRWLSGVLLGFAIIGAVVFAMFDHRYTARYILVGCLLANMAVLTFPLNNKEYV